MAVGDELKISDAAEETGFDVSTIRYYERIGLIPPPTRNEGGHRIYHANDVERLALIARAKNLGLSLEDIKSFLAQWERGACPSARRMLEQLVAAKLDDLRRRMEELQIFHDALSDAYDELRGHPTQQRCEPGCGCDVEIAGHRETIELGALSI